MEFSEILKGLMEERGLSIKEVSNGSGVSESTINKHLKGESDPRLLTLVAYRQYFKVKIDYLAGLTDKKEKPAHV